MDRLVPGFVRVEVLLNRTVHGPQEQLDPISIDHDWDGAPYQFDPHYCCHVHMEPNVETPVKPDAEDVVVWETSIKALSVRQLPAGSDLLDWVVLLPGPGKRLSAADLMGGYWSGRDGAFGDEGKPSPGMPD